ncbi:hypothetical protein Q7A53_05325 [Halobacillus rhizosphaerae]|uniref:hypothetical protein n=1 Tax=Halobacillus rhizosphaerae TaxID=3064889 RepID=UPI00398A5EE7
MSKYTVEPKFKIGDKFHDYSNGDTLKIIGVSPDMDYKGDYAYFCEIEGDYAYFCEIEDYECKTMYVCEFEDYLESLGRVFYYENNL